MSNDLFYYSFIYEKIAQVCYSFFYWWLLLFYVCWLQGKQAVTLRCHFVKKLLPTSFLTLCSFHQDYCAQCHVALAMLFHFSWIVVVEYAVLRQLRCYSWLWQRNHKFVQSAIPPTYSLFAILALRPGLHSVFLQFCTVYLCSNVCSSHTTLPPLLISGMIYYICFV